MFKATTFTLNYIGQAQITKENNFRPLKGISMKVFAIPLFHARFLLLHKSFYRSDMKTHRIQSDAHRASSSLTAAADGKTQ